MATCDWLHGECDRIATTTLTRNNGEVALLCEEHREETIRLLRKAAEANVFTPEVDHWFILNKIPS
jgi:hypothetical protein